jgi:hypothetical protein
MKGSAGGLKPRPLVQTVLRLVRQSISVFLRIAETLYPFVFTQFRTQNRCALLLELL